MFLISKIPNICKSRGLLVQTFLLPSFEYDLSFPQFTYLFLSDGKLILKLSYLLPFRPCFHTDISLRFLNDF